MIYVRFPVGHHAEGEYNVYSSVNRRYFECIDNSWKSFYVNIPARTHTDVLLVKDLPFITLEEARLVSNIWYHRDSDQLYRLTPKGFKIMEGASKQVLKDRGII